MDFIKALDTATNRNFLIYGWGNKENTYRGVYEDDSTASRSSISSIRFPRVYKKQVEKVHKANQFLLPRNISPNDGQPKVDKDFLLPIKELIEGTDVKSCVFKLFYGKKFVIIKGKYLHMSLRLFSIGYSAFHHNPENHNQHSGHVHFYFAMYLHIRKNWGKFEFNVEIVKESESGYELLKAEQDELDKYINKPALLNSNITAYIPKKSDWIPQEDIERFKNEYDI